MKKTTTKVISMPVINSSEYMKLSEENGKINELYYIVDDITGLPISQSFYDCKQDEESEYSTRDNKTQWKN